MLTQTTRAAVLAFAPGAVSFVFFMTYLSGNGNVQLSRIA
jgi:hypothetical protein